MAKKKQKKLPAFALGAIDDMTFQAFVEFDREFGPGELLINSWGGSLRDAFALHDYIRAVSPAWKAVVVGACYSAALLPLMACSQRAITPTGDIMIHHGVTGGGVPGNEFDAWVRASHVARESYLRVLESRSKAGREQLLKLQDAGRYLSAEESLRLGFVTKLLPFKR